MKIWLVTLLTFWAQFASAQAEEKVEIEQATSVEKAVNFGVVYVAQWAVYGATQTETIRKYGSWKNFVEYPLKPEFDKDHFSYNVFKHTLSGNYYYLFYRSRGYSVKDAFYWSFLSSLSFEFTVETLTEKPSLQDIYQTPVFGTIAGMTFENISTNLLASDNKLIRFFGFVFNPFKLLPQTDEVISIIPLYEAKTYGLRLTAEF